MVRRLIRPSNSLSEKQGSASKWAYEQGSNRAVGVDEPADSFVCFASESPKRPHRDFPPQLAMLWSTLLHFELVPHVLPWSAQLNTSSPVKRHYIQCFWDLNFPWTLHSQLDNYIHSHILYLFNVDHGACLHTCTLWIDLKIISHSNFWSYNR